MAGSGKQSILMRKWSEDWKKIGWLGNSTSRRGGHGSKHGKYKIIKVIRMQGVRWLDDIANMSKILRTLMGRTEDNPGKDGWKSKN